MNDTIVTVQTGQGTMPIEIFRPAGDADLPAVILFMDAPGIRPELRDAARRVAKSGFVCALPDLYYRFGHIRIDLTRRTEAHGALYKTLSAGLKNRDVAMDTAGILSCLAGLPGVRPGPVGCLGFSVGGRYALQAAGLFPGLVGAVATICGTGLVTAEDDSPHRVIAAASGAGFALDFAEDDPAMPPDDIERLRATFAEAGIDADIVVHPGTQHGFTFAMRPMFDSLASERAWTRALDLFGEGRES